MTHFGQPPLAAHLPLKAGQNLADLPNKATSRTNLDVFSKDETLLHGVPVGTIISFYGTVAPAGYLPCHGQVVVSSTYPELVQFLNPGQPSAVLPDLRGEFLRGLDQGRGIDPGRTLGSAQRGTITVMDPSFTASGLATPIGRLDYAQSAFGVEAGYDNVSESYFPNVLKSWTTTPNSPTTLLANGWAFGVTRPRNVAAMFCIKAYGALTNVGTVDVGKVLSELSDTVKIADFGKSLTNNGYQKLPGGLIFQWGLRGTPLGEGSSSQVMDVTFPIAFPNACLTAVASCGTNYGDYDTVYPAGTPSTLYRTDRTYVTVSAPTKVGFDAQLFADTNIINGRLVQWMAVGY